MKTKRKELSVDYIGGQGSLTLAEEKELSEYFTKKKPVTKKGNKKTKAPREKSAKEKA